jgi:hypothetical protein
MKTTSRLAAAALFSALLTPSVFAQPAGSVDPSRPMTRAEVRADLAAWRAAGYDPLDWINYPENAQQAGRIVAEHRGQAMGVGAAPATTQ